ncbi:hypothetical protein QVD17_40742 [Tagetes erecta]|uniref:DUF2828 domain-containing protein n=1 Tax=Tagetes erecta TaxID=13708 RepID=A0AAD8JW94_TARER|nr:hypothetical protein QVD17_40742 [Tagetes erecta]
MAPTTTSLLGPPEIYRSHQTSVVAPPSSTIPTHPFVDAMVSHFNSFETGTGIKLVGYTENMSVTYLSTGNPCIDFFFHIVPNTAPETIVRRLQQSWEHDALITLKLICNLRGVRGTGKSDKEGFYTSALWLHKHHPKTLACNVASMAKFGYFKDLPEILYRLLHGADVRKIAKEEHLKRSTHRQSNHCRFNGSKRFANKRVPREQRISLEKKRIETVRINASKNINDKRIMMAKKAIERYNHDLDYKFLHDRVSDVFAELLRSDIRLLTAGDSAKISLAAKWCPSLDSSFDKSTLLCETIAKKVFPREEYKEYDGVEEAHYAYRVRDRLRKEVLVPLRRALELPEVFIGQNQWNLIPYSRVASVAMKNYKDKFLKHDRLRFEEYLQNVRSGKAKIAAGALLPHEIISCLEDEDGDEVAELQWKRIVDDMLKKGKLNNCLAVCDVSGSMSGIPMSVSVALGVLVSELSEEPWKGKLITFSENPELEIVEGDDLRSKIEFVKNMEWGMNTDFQKVFDLILEVALNGRVSADEMIKRVFVFSDMEFDQASANAWETDYDVIRRKFVENGYGDAVPEIVFWNLRDSRATPVTGKEKGVALVSGFSKNLMTLFMEDGGRLNPESVMESAISGEEYKKLVVVD